MDDSRGHETEEALRPMWSYASGSEAYGMALHTLGSYLRSPYLDLVASSEAGDTELAYERETEMSRLRAQAWRTIYSAYGAGAEDGAESARGAAEEGTVQLQVSRLDEALPLPQRPATATPNRVEFRAGVIAAGGTHALAMRFLERILPCESAGQGVGGRIDWTPGNKAYRSAAQFHPGSWLRVERELDMDLAFGVPFDVGRAVAIWVRLIGEENIATRSGWEYCGKR